MAGYSRRTYTPQRRKPPTPTTVGATRTLPTLTPSAQQQAVFDWIVHGTGSAIISAVAGSGKTTTLVYGTQKMQGTVIVLAFNKKIADELTDKLAGLTQPAEASTFHSAGFRVWRTVAPHARVDASKTWKILEEFTELPKSMRTFVQSAVSIAKQSCFGVEGCADIDDIDAWHTLVEHHLLDEKLRRDRNSGEFADSEELLESAIEWSIDVLKESIERAETVVDFDDMIYMPLLSDVQPRTQYDWVLVDEAQDSNEGRRTLAAKLLAPGGRLIAVGDPAQAIYGFTGADSEALDLIRKRFNTTELPLTVSYRCPRAVVEVARTYVSHIEPADTAIEGVVEYTNEDDWRAHWLRGEGRDVLVAKPSDHAVLCRVTKALIPIVYDMIAADIPAHIEGREIAAQLVALVQKFENVRTFDTLRIRIEDYRDKEVERATKRKKFARAEAIADQCDALLEIMKRMPKGSTPQTLIMKIESLFEDTNGKRSTVTLSTIHKSKGREWEHVHWWGENAYQPSKYATLEWMQTQEVNLCYVAATRAKHTLTRVNVDPKAS